jgi:hypothetical protein
MRVMVDIVCVEERESEKPAASLAVVALMIWKMQGQV